MDSKKRVCKEIIKNTNNAVKRVSHMILILEILKHGWSKVFYTLKILS